METIYHMAHFKVFLSIEGYHLNDLGSGVFRSVHTTQGETRVSFLCLIVGMLAFTPQHFFVNTPAASGALHPSGFRWRCSIVPSIVEEFLYGQAQALSDLSHLLRVSLLSLVFRRESPTSLLCCTRKGSTQ